MKSLSSIIFIHVLFFIGIQTTQAQSIWNDITLYTKGGDSIQGEIRIKTHFKDFYSIAVRDKATKETKEYKPADLQSFIIKTPEQQLYFKSFQVEADFSPTDLAALDVSPAVKLEKDLVFAELLVKGEKELYHYKDNRVYKEHYLIKISDDQAMDLVNKHYYINSARSATAYFEEYKKQLNKLLIGSAKVNSGRISKTFFSRSALKALIKDYNASFNPPNSYELKEEKLRVKVGVVAGYHTATLNYTGADKELNQIVFDPSKGLNAGLKLDLILPKTRKQWSIYNELLFSNYRFKSGEFYIYNTNQNDYQTKQIKMEATFLKLVNAVRFRFPYEIAPFIQAGIVNGFAVNYKAIETKHHVFYSANNYSEEPFPFRRYEQSIFAGVGCSYKGFGLEFRYEMGNGMSVGSQIGSKMRYTYVLVSYTF